MSARVCVDVYVCERERETLCDRGCHHTHYVGDAQSGSQEGLIDTEITRATRDNKLIGSWRDRELKVNRVKSLTLFI